MLENWKEKGRHQGTNKQLQPDSGIEDTSSHCPCIPSFNFVGLTVPEKSVTKIKNQRTSGPVNAHPTPGLGIYFNAFIHVYSPRAGADNPLGTNVDVNRKPLSLYPFVASFKTISLKYDF